MKNPPNEIKREINRMAHALAMWSYVEHRRQLEAETLARLNAGEPASEVLAGLRRQRHQSWRQGIDGDSA